MLSHSSYANFKRLLRNYGIQFLMVILEQRLSLYTYFILNYCFTGYDYCDFRIENTIIS